MKRQHKRRVVVDMTPEDLEQGIADCVKVGVLEIVGEQNGNPLVQKTTLDRVITPYLKPYSEQQQMEFFGIALLLIRNRGCTPLEAWTTIFGDDIQTGVAPHEKP